MSEDPGADQPDIDRHATDRYATTPPTPDQLRRWQRYLANERAEAQVYRELARKRTGEEREILLKLAEAESRHEAHWRGLLGDAGTGPHKPDLRTRILGVLARRFGSVFSLALMQSAESRSPYSFDDDATEQMSADERIHAEVIRGLATRGRERMSGNFRSTVFGINDGLVSNLALVIGVMASGVAPQIVLLTGLSGLLSGALSMAAGEYISVRSQLELLDASTPDPETRTAISELDVDANELELVYRARGMTEHEAAARAAAVFTALVSSRGELDDAHLIPTTDREETGSARSAALFSFLSFSVGAFIPIIPLLFGLGGVVAGIVALVLVGVSLMFTGGLTGVLSGKPPLYRALRQLLVGLGAASITYTLGLAFGTIL